MDRITTMAGVIWVLFFVFIIHDSVYIPHVAYSSPGV